MALKCCFSIIFLFGLVLLQNQSVHANRQQRFCGRMLRDRIAAICNSLGGYNTFVQVAPYHIRVRRHVVDECCKRPCSIHTIAQYCAHGFEDIAERLSEKENKNAVENFRYQKSSSAQTMLKN